MCLWDLWQRTAPWCAINFVSSCKSLLVWGQRGRRAGIYPRHAPFFPPKLWIWTIDFLGLIIVMHIWNLPEKTFFFLVTKYLLVSLGPRSLTQIPQWIGKGPITRRFTNWPFWAVHQEGDWEKISFQSTSVFLNLWSFCIWNWLVQINYSVELHILANNNHRIKCI